MKLATVIRQLEQWAPPAYQESYDNSRLLTGHNDMEVTGILTSLDCTEAVLDEAIARGCNVVLAHHPIIFGGLKSLTGRTYVERTVIKAIKNDIAVYAFHTNLDNVATGVNHKIAERIGLRDTRILSLAPGKLAKLEVVCPTDVAENIRQAAFSAGAGDLGKYRESWFGTEGLSGYTPKENANPRVGQAGTASQGTETLLTFTLPVHRQGVVLAAIRTVHPYEEFDHKLTALLNSHPDVGSGMIGRLPEPEESQLFLQRIKDLFGCGTVKHTALVKSHIQTVALCGGSGFFLLPQAIAGGADIYLTSDIKYHEFFDADGHIVLADIGHYESEQFTKELLADYLKNAFTGLMVAVSTTTTNPVNYL